MAARRKRNSGSKASPAWSPVRSSQPLSRRAAAGHWPFSIQIHEQEGQVIHHVDAGEPVVELDAVEQDRTAFEDDVGEVEVAVAVADKARGPPLVQERPMANEQILGASVEIAHRPGREHGWHGRVEIDAVALGDLAHGGEPTHVGAPCRRGMGPGQGLGQAVDQRVVEPGRGGDAVELGPGRKAAHLEQPLDGLAGAVQGEAEGSAVAGRTRR